MTLGGRLADLESHIAQVRAHPLFTQRDIDFKLAASSGAINAQTSEETGFTQLHVRLCKVRAALHPATCTLSRAQSMLHSTHEGRHCVPLYVRVCICV